MRSATLLTVMSFFLLLSACSNSESDRIRNEARQTLPAAPPATVAAPQAAPAFPSMNAVPHYKCPNSCAGGIGDTAGACPVCGTQMAHNQAYHDQANATTVTPGALNPAAAPQTTTPSPAQNAAGVYHYTCSNGCAGGAGSPVACATCGAMLAHNQAYHGN